MANCIQTPVSKFTSHSCITEDDGSENKIKDNMVMALLNNVISQNSRYGGPKI